MKDGDKRTNVTRLLTLAGVRHAVLAYDSADGLLDAVSVARKTGREPERVYKTLVAVGKNTGVGVFVIPAPGELDLKKAAAAAGDKNMVMLKQRELEPLTGYVHGGCSPIGMKKAFPTYIEETAALFATILVSAGRIGLQVELTPADLAALTRARFCDLV
jgi:Cys-tRNA(Pro)/Cys-tRNA(Cys) deacylase